MLPTRKGGPYGARCQTAPCPARQLAYASELPWRRSPTMLGFLRQMVVYARGADSGRLSWFLYAGNADIARPMCNGPTKPQVAIVCGPLKACRLVQNPCQSAKICQFAYLAPALRLPDATHGSPGWAASFRSSPVYAQPVGVLPTGARSIPVLEILAVFLRCGDFLDARLWVLIKLS